MFRLVGSLAIAVMIAQWRLPLSAQAKDQPARSIGIHTLNGWMLEVCSDGSGLRQFGMRDFEKVPGLRVQDWLYV